MSRLIQFLSNPFGSRSHVEETEILDFIHKLPRDVFGIVLSFISTADLLKFETVDRYCKSVVFDPILWKLRAPIMFEVKIYKVDYCLYYIYIKLV